MNLRSTATAIGRRAWHVLAALAVTLMTGCGNMMGDVDGNWQMPIQASKEAADIDWVYYFIFWICLFYFVHIMGAMGWFMWRYRRIPGKEVEESPHHSLSLEIAWSIPPILLCVVMFYLGFDYYMQMSIPPADAIKIEVQAEKWSWKFRYHNGAESDELHIPKDKPVVFLLTSRDVLHAFYLPKMRVKKDIVPGRTTKAWTTANRAGDYTLFCAEYCGRSHSMMRAPVTVHETEAGWLAAIRPGRASPEKLFRMNCSSCHSIDTPEILTGPSLKGIGMSKRQVAAGGGAPTKEVLADRAYLKESILRPGALLSRMGKDFKDEMNKTFAKQLKPEQIESLVDYLLDPKKAMEKFEAELKKAEKK
ncbi:MAG: cytochrome c oxidase subunit II [Planctomycetes bacterium]|nr:cytochrome c oxidase subunit II [Planctomycetota bacterium]